MKALESSDEEADVVVNAALRVIENAEASSTGWQQGVVRG